MSGGVIVAIDIGGTNYRVMTEDRDGKQVQLGKKQASTVKDLLRGLKDTVSAVDESVVGAVLAIAGPVVDGSHVTLTNYKGEEKTLRKEDLYSFLPEGRITLLNDVEATAYGLLAVDMQEYFGSEPLSNQGNYLCLAPGTGLGCAALLSLPDILHGREVRSLHVVPLEVGHVAAAMNSEQERQLINRVGAMAWDGEHAAEYEDFVSGRGLRRLYELSSDEACPNLDLSTLVQKSADGDPHATYALTHFYSFLARCVSQLCVLLGGGVKAVYLAGDNQVANNPFLDDNPSFSLRPVFEAGSKSEWVKETSIFTQRKSKNLNLQGALYMGRQFFKK